MEVAKHRSPDGILELVVLRDHTGDWTVGFTGNGAWHTHGEVLCAEYALCGIDAGSPEEAVERFVREILTGELAVCVERRGDAVVSIFVTLDPTAALRSTYRPADLRVQLRFWSGASWPHPPD